MPADVLAEALTRQLSVRSGPPGKRLPTRPPTGLILDELHLVPPASVYKYTDGRMLGSLGLRGHSQRQRVEVPLK